MAKYDVWKIALTEGLFGNLIIGRPIRCMKSNQNVALIS